MAKPLAIVFARAPRYGAVKSRLARDIGASETLRFHRQTLSNTVRRLALDGRFEVAVAVTPDRFRTLPLQVRVFDQGEGDLGRRMVRALRAAGPRPAVVVGCDIPGMTAAHVRAAFVLLGQSPFVLGAASDGGYWLIGARHPGQLRTDMLDGVRWSSPHALSDTAIRLGDVSVLPGTLDDVDDGAAYRRVMARD